MYNLYSNLLYPLDVILTSTKNFLQGLYGQN